MTRDVADEVTRILADVAAAGQFEALYVGRLPDGSLRVIVREVRLNRTYTWPDRMAWRKPLPPGNLLEPAAVQPAKEASRPSDQVDATPDEGARADSQASYYETEDTRKKKKSRAAADLPGQKTLW